MYLNILQWVGYAASVIIMISLTLNSIVKFRWINLVGAAMFSTYGFLIKAYPVGVMNGLIVLIDIYYLWQIYTKKEIFEIIEISSSSEYLERFVRYHDKDIQKICPGFAYDPALNNISFFILRNMAVAGLFLAHRENESELVVGLDFVIPEYRDFKNGQYIYNQLRPKFKEAGYTTVRAAVSNPINDSYFEKLGFEPDENGVYRREL